MKRLAAKTTSWQKAKKEIKTKQQKVNNDFRNYKGYNKFKQRLIQATIKTQA